MYSMIQQGRSTGVDIGGEGANVDRSSPYRGKRPKVGSPHGGVFEHAPPLCDFLKH